MDQRSLLEPMLAGDEVNMPVVTTVTGIEEKLLGDEGSRLIIQITDGNNEVGAILHPQFDALVNNGILRTNSTIRIFDYHVAAFGTYQRNHIFIADLCVSSNSDNSEEVFEFAETNEPSTSVSTQLLEVHRRLSTTSSFGGSQTSSIFRSVANRLSGSTVSSNEIIHVGSPSKCAYLKPIKVPERVH